MSERSNVIPFRRPDSSKPKKTSGAKLAKSQRARIEALVAGWVDSELGQFADHLVTARTFLRKYPELVTAAEFPDHLRGPYEKFSEGDDPDNSACGFGEPVVSAKEIREYRRHAKEIVCAQQSEAAV